VWRTPGKNERDCRSNATIRSDDVLDLLRASISATVFSVSIVQEFCMKKVVFASLLAAAATTGVLYTPPQAIAQDQAQPGQITIKDPAEYNDYTNAVSQSAPAAKAAAIEAFLTKYPNSVVKKDLLTQLLTIYQSTDLNKTLDTASRILAIDPTNLRALAISVYIEKQQAAQKTNPADAQPILDKAATQSNAGLAAPKPADMPQADFDKLKAATTPIFYSALALDDENKKDYASAIADFKKELASYADPAATQVMPALNDTYLLGLAYTQETPPDLPNAVWYLARAAHYAPAQAQPQIEKAAEYFYNKYHGGMDGFPAIQQEVQTAVNPPADYKPTAAPPPPSPADQAHAAVVAGGADLKNGLNLSDKEFVLFNGSPDDAGKVWAVLNDGKPVEIPGKVIQATADSVQIAVTEDNKNSNKADFTINMKEPLKTVPAVGSDITLIGTFDSYTANPPMIVLKDGSVPAPTKPSARKTTKKTAS